MTRFQAAWLPGGEVELEDIPLAGEREMRKLALKDAEFLASLDQERVLKYREAVFKADRAVTAGRAGPAKDAWDAFAQVWWPHDASLRWTAEEFPKAIAVARDAIVAQTDASGLEDAEAKLTAEATALYERLKAFGEDTWLRLRERGATALTWRLWASGVRKVVTAAGDIPLDWPKPGDPDGPAKRAAIVEVVLSVVSQAQLDSLAPAPKPRPLDREDLKPQTAADVEGKSVPVSEPSTPFSPVSTPSSASATVTVTA